MSDLIKNAKARVGQAELYVSRNRRLDVRYADSRLAAVTADDPFSTALRVIDKGRLGAAFGVLPDDPGLLARAKAAAALGDPAGFSFSRSRRFAEVHPYDAETARLETQNLIDLCEKVRKHIGPALPDVALSLRASATRENIEIETSGGTHAAHEGSCLSLEIHAPIRGGGPAGRQREVVRLAVRRPAGPRGRVRRVAPLDGEAMAKGTSPLARRLGEPILSPLSTVVDDPLVLDKPQSRAFDDEGVPCRRRSLVKKGVLKSLLLDLHSAAQLGQSSTGNGYKRRLFGSGPEIAPNPWPGQILIEPGETPWRELLSSIDDGLLVADGLGFHFANYPQGQFSVQALGYHVKRGRVAGRLERTMIAGNIYEDFQRVLAVSREQLEGGPAYAPYVLVDSIQVAGS
jgi:predicted Zn-dependent protease